jgi:hypothetical protein
MIGTDKKLDLIILNQKVIIAVLIKFLKADGIGKHEEAIELLNGQIDLMMTSRAYD